MNSPQAECSCLNAIHTFYFGPGASQTATRLSVLPLDHTAWVLMDKCFPLSSG
jgi:hypothetical protein